jgi:hypothetical protein
MIRKPTGDIVGKTKQDKNQLEAQVCLLPYFMRATL